MERERGDWMNGTVNVSQSGAQFEAALTGEERERLATLTSPMAIQEYLDSVAYSTDDRYRAPLSVLRDGRAHCFDGACFAAMALSRLGYPPLLVDMLPWDDDDHVLAIWKRGDAFGAVAKSNFTGLRYREPVYASLRELVMSYFESFFNLAGNRTLRGYTECVNVSQFDEANWMSSDFALDRIADALDAAARVELFSNAEIAAFTKVDRVTFDTNIARADAAGLHQPTHK